MEISELRSLLEGVKGGEDKFTARCPAHGDRHNSLSVGLGQDGRILMKCHAGCDLQKILDALGLQMGDLFADAPGKPAPKRQKPADLRDISIMPIELVKAKTLAASAPSPAPAAAKRARGETQMQKCKFEDIVYQYHTQEGENLFQVVRRQFADGTKTFRQRVQDGKGKYIYTLKDITPVLYRLPKLRLAVAAGADVYLCEGEKDADALCNIGLCATTAPMGAGKWRDGYTEQLAGARRVLILPDNDKPGRAHALAVAEKLAAAGVPAQIVDLKAQWEDLPKKGDVSDILAQQGASAARLFGDFALSPDAFRKIAQLRDLVDDAPDYRFNSTARYMEKEFWEEVGRTARQPALSTGFAGLDAQMDGRLYPGLYVIGSVSSLGKTAFCLQMADAIAAQGTDVLFFTLEMSRMEMVARSLTRYIYIDSGYKSEVSIGHILHGRLEDDVMDSAAQAYHASSARHISFLQGDFATSAQDVVQAVTLHKAATGRRPVVFVDYMQILKSPDVRMSDKQAMDSNVVTLKRLSRELDVPVIAVSSFNRQNYTEEVNMASFKESGAIEYSADFVLGLQAQGVSNASDAATDDKKLARAVAASTKAAKQKIPRPIEAVTLKNRRGPAWACFGLEFYPKQNFFKELRTV